MTGQVPGEKARGAHRHGHPLSAFGPGAWSFTGVQDNTDVFSNWLQRAANGVVLRRWHRHNRCASTSDMMMDRHRGIGCFVGNLPSLQVVPAWTKTRNTNVSLPVIIGNPPATHCQPVGHAIPPSKFSSNHLVSSLPKCLGISLEQLNESKRTVFAYLMTQGSAAMLMKIEPDLQGQFPGAMGRYPGTSSCNKHITRMAFVGDLRWRDTALLFHGLVPFPMEYFPEKQAELARAWLTVN